MTVINLENFIASLGGNDPYSGTLTITPWAGAKPYIKVDGPEVIFPGPITLEILDGIPVEPIDIDPTDGTHCIRWVLTGKNYPSDLVRLERYTSIPDIAAIDFGDLQDVDRWSFLPTDEAVTAWEDAIGEVLVLRNETVLARNAAQDAANTALTGQFLGTVISNAGVDFNTLSTPGIYRFGSVAGNASTNNPIGGAGILEVYLVAGAVVIQRFIPTVASGRVWYMRALNNGSSSAGWMTHSYQRIVNPTDQPGIAMYTRDDVNDRDQQIQPIGIALGTVDLNLVTLPGIYQQITTGSATLARNYPIAGVSGVLEVLNGLIQRWTTQGGSSFARGFYQRRMLNGTWSSWFFLSYQTVDETAGRAFYTWDDANNRTQLLHGDTGWRDISSQLDPAQWTGNVYVRRVGYQCELIVGSLVSVDAGTLMLTLPVGYRPLRQFPIMARAGFNSDPPVYGSIGTAGAVALVAGRTFNATTLQASWSTVDAWPSALPGVALGSIPSG